MHLQAFAPCKSVENLLMLQGKPCKAPLFRVFLGFLPLKHGEPPPWDGSLPSLLLRQVLFSLNFWLMPQPGIHCEDYAFNSSGSRVSAFSEFEGPSCPLPAPETIASNSQPIPRASEPTGTGVSKPCVLQASQTSLGRSSLSSLEPKQAYFRVSRRKQSDSRIALDAQKQEETRGA